ncbi:MAG: hypothetical protein EZS28_043170, partial [Streblomastix strix]
MTSLEKQKESEVKNQEKTNKQKEKERNIELKNKEKQSEKNSKAEQEEQNASVEQVEQKAQANAKSAMWMNGSDTLLLKQRGEIKKNYIRDKLGKFGKVAGIVLKNPAEITPTFPIKSPFESETTSDDSSSPMINLTPSAPSTQPQLKYQSVTYVIVKMRTREEGKKVYDNKGQLEPLKIDYYSPEIEEALLKTLVITSQAPQTFTPLNTTLIKTKEEQKEKQKKKDKKREENDTKGENDDNDSDSDDEQQDQKGSIDDINDGLSRAQRNREKKKKRQLEKLAEQERIQAEIKRDAELKKLRLDSEKRRKANQEKKFQVEDPEKEINSLLQFALNNPPENEPIKQIRIKGQEQQERSKIVVVKEKPTYEQTYKLRPETKILLEQKQEILQESVNQNIQTSQSNIQTAQSNIQTTQSSSSESEPSEQNDEKKPINPFINLSFMLSQARTQSAGVGRNIQEAVCNIILDIVKEDAYAIAQGYDTDILKELKLMVGELIPIEEIK